MGLDQFSEADIERYVAEARRHEYGRETVQATFDDYREDCEEADTAPARQKRPGISLMALPQGVDHGAESYEMRFDRRNGRMEF